MNKLASLNELAVVPNHLVQICQGANSLEVLKFALAI